MAAARLYGFVVGLVFVLAGVVGYAWTGFTGWIEAGTDDFLFWFRLNPTQNLLHLVLGCALMVGAADGEATARTVTAVVAAVFVAAGIVGFFLTDRPDANVLALNFADNVLHLVVGGAGLLAAWLSLAAAPRLASRPG